MSKWLDRLRKASKGIPTKPTKPGSVSFVSIPSGHFQNIAPTELPLSLIKEKTRKQQGTDLLALVADLLGTRPALLLEGAYLLECDLVELVDADASQIAYTIRTSPAWINRPQQVGQQIEQIVEEEIELSEIIITAATATPVWRGTRDNFHNHLIICCACHAPTRRYCPAGTELRAIYNNTSMEQAQ